MGVASDVALYTDRLIASDSSDSSGIERVPTREEMSELLAAAAAASHSARGRLKALAHVVRVLRHCPWIAGTLRLELERAGDDTTLVHVFAEHDGDRECALPSAVLDVPLEQLRAAMRSNPDLFAPLKPCDGEEALVFAA